MANRKGLGQHDPPPNPTAPISLPQPMNFATLASYFHPVPIVLSLGLTVGVSSEAYAQGDTCATATPIAGTGTWTFDQTVFNTSGFQGLGPCQTAGTPFFKDGFFQWVAPANGDYQIDTNASTFDTQLALHAGSGCPAVCVAYDDDSGPGTRSLLLLSGVMQGDSYLIQVGGYSDQEGQASLRIGEVCAGPDDGFDPNNTCAMASPIVPGFYPDLFVGFATPDFYSITIPAGGQLDVDLTTQSFDVDFRIYDGACNFLLSRGGDWSYTNPSSQPLDLIFEAYADPSNEAECTDYWLEVILSQDACFQPIDDDLEDNDDCAQAVSPGNGTWLDRFVSQADPDHFAFCVPAGGTVFVEALFDHGEGDIDLFLWDAIDINCGTGFGSTALVISFSGSDNESLQWTNLSGADQNYVLEVSVHPSSSRPCNRYDLAIAGSGGCGTGSFGPAFCTQLPINSAGFRSRLWGTLGSAAESGLHLEVTNGPPGQFGYLLFSSDFQDPGLPVGQGQLCLDVQQGVGRYNVGGSVWNSTGIFDGQRRWQNLSNTSVSGFGFDVPATLPLPGTPTILAGSNWSFQLWHREPNGGSNFSSGLPVQF